VADAQTGLTPRGRPRTTRPASDPYTQVAACVHSLYPGTARPLIGDQLPQNPTSQPPCYSHSIVPGGLLVMSSTTRPTERISLIIRFEMRSSRS
jgi:hypothetical protein